MFSGLSNFFFGSSTTENDEHVETEASQGQTCTAPHETAESRLQPHCDTANQPQNTCRLKTSNDDDDEWVLVDKSSRGNSPARMEVDPMENLLIEHPSMSVYGPRGRQNSTGVDSVHSESSEDMAAETQPSTARGRQSMVSQRHPPRRPRAVAARAGLVSMRSEKTIKIAERRYRTRGLTKTNMVRCNRVNAVNGRGKSAHRRDQRIHQPAGRANNRRC